MTYLGTSLKVPSACSCFSDILFVSNLVILNNFVGIEKDLILFSILAVIIKPIKSNVSNKP